MREGHTGVGEASLGGAHFDAETGETHDKLLDGHISERISHFFDLLPLHGSRTVLRIPCLGGVEGGGRFGCYDDEQTGSLRRYGCRYRYARMNVRNLDVEKTFQSRMSSC